MQLGLSSAAAPDLSIAELVKGCRTRGLGALELVLGHAHGVRAGATREELREAMRVTSLRDVRIAAVSHDIGDDDGGGASHEETIEIAGRLGVRAVIDASLPIPQVRRLVDHAVGAGAGFLLMHGTHAGRAAELAALVEPLPEAAAGLAWEVNPALDDPADVPAVMEAAKSRLRLVRLRGGGPEALQQTGMGIGAVMARLALARFHGPIILTPTSRAYHRAWAAWLGHGGGWGCGSKQSDASLVTLDVKSTTNSAGIAT